MTNGKIKIKMITPAVKEANKIVKDLLSGSSTAAADESGMPANL